MAGFIVSTWDSPEAQKKNLISRIFGSFERNRFLEPSFSIKEDRLFVSKYKRKGQGSDNNYFDESDLCVFAVGFVLYGTNAADDSIAAIVNDIRAGKSVPAICDALDGAFCLVIVKKQDAKIHVITDVSGIIQVYHYQRDGIHVLSTSELAITRNFPVTASLNGMASFLRITYILRNDSLFEEIKVLEPASHYVLNLQDSTLSVSTYFTFPTEIDWKISYDDACHRLEKALDNILAKLPKEQTIVDFTGGNDSRFITALMYRHGENKKIHSALFSGPINSSEYQLIKSSCADLGINFCGWIPDSSFEENFFSYILDAFEVGGGEENAAIHAPILWANLQKRENGFRYSLHGMCGELYRDQRWDHEFGSRGKKRPANLQRLVQWRVFPYEFDMAVFSQDFIPLLKKVPDWFLQAYQETVASIDPTKAPNTLQLDTIYLKNNMRKWGGKTISGANQIICSVGPYLFRAPLTVTLSIDPKYRKGAKIMKEIAEKVAPSVAALKTQAGTPFMVWRISRFYFIVPFINFWTKKLIRKLSQILFGKTVLEGVTVEEFDLYRRFRCALDDPRCMDVLTYERMKTRELYDRDAFRDFIDRAKQPGFEHYKILGGIITLELAMREANLRAPIGISRETDAQSGYHSAEGVNSP